MHSVIIGLALGASDSPKTIRPLLAALSFHQLFEGLGLGGCITQVMITLFYIVFSLFFFPDIRQNCIFQSWNSFLYDFECFKCF